MTAITNTKQQDTSNKLDHHTAMGQTSTMFSIITDLTLLSISNIIADIFHHYDCIQVARK